jgi:hypothetical protein
MRSARTIVVYACPDAAWPIKHTRARFSAAGRTLQLHWLRFGSPFVVRRFKTTPTGNPSKGAQEYQGPQTDSVLIEGYQKKLCYASPQPALKPSPFRHQICSGGPDSLIIIIASPQKGNYGASPLPRWLRKLLDPLLNGDSLISRLKS